MKALVTVLCFFLLISCSDTSENGQNEYETSDIANFKTIIQTLETTLIDNNGKSVIYESSKVIKIEENYYLRSRSKNMVTTTLLIENGDGTLSSRGVSCSSVDCASSTTGCIPNSATSCSRCNGGNGDCKKTVTGFK